MNAQEAIEITKQTINRFSTVLSELERMVLKYQENESQKFGDEEVLKLKKEIEALSIVLESAKYLHRDILEPSRQTEWHGASGNRLSIIYDIPEEGIEIMDDNLEKIGIKEYTK